ncbi:YkgJ family cysteine cluster protein [Burkholderia multivorans]|uniref:YkgJ family cysteine cluster protein n=2 Tax=Burkholderia multivorans TaxID=87883 RepID=UPI001591EC8F|nr:YkgJ family cysteine cluster protein [Burkholderia multivorans]MBU9305619.1 YkgJ family cysteine cluster protein [Burkholderia multivorans]MBU9408230.1 YkgJ family cysteine cluster protein [Burkholderia multivorans]HEM7840135.1 YkgJ family cysteine cluster protein [Burkholderia multivorans]HEM7870428.1 YkgJ family cysteine cluster protein [Burkholderia multivorans]
MKAMDAIPIIEAATAELESMEPSWRNCKACPHSGKCCDNAHISLVFPEEAAEIVEYLRANPEKMAYAKSRFSRGKDCYFHDPSANRCLIHDVRPILCRWTPHTTFFNGNGPWIGMIRDLNCGFTAIGKDDRVVPIKPGFVEVWPARATVTRQKFIHLQAINAIHPLLARVHEAVDMRVVLNTALNID